MGWFKNTSIRRKLVFLLMLSSEIALVFACFGFVIYDRYTLMVTIKRDSDILASIISQNSTAAIQFNDTEDARDILSALKVKTHIVSACIYTKDGNIFAKYVRDGDQSNFVPPPPEKNTYRFTSTYLKIFKSIILNQENIGTIYILADLEEINHRFNQILGIIAVFVIISTIFVFLISRELQEFISEPILNLANVAQKVSSKKDYTVRANKKGDDEIGLLTETFNEMLQQIQTQDEHLQKELVEHMQTENELKKSLQEKEVLLKEIHHRVKNNLQIISSLSYLQSRNIHDEATLQMLKDSQNRIKSMALIHEKLYQSKDLAKIDFQEYTQSLLTHLFHSYRINSSLINYEIEIEDIALTVDTAIGYGMIINELISNSLKHAFPNRRSGRIQIRLFQEQNTHQQLMVSDNGIGFPADIDYKTTKSLGLQLVCNLADQLNGTIELDRYQGTVFRITFPMKYKPSNGQ